jgi:hypothetical protein
MSIITNIIKYADILPVNHILSLNSQEGRLKTSIGGCLTIITLSAITLLTLSTFSTYLNTNHYLETTEEILTDNFKLNGSSYKLKPLVIMVPDSLINRTRLKIGYTRNHTVHVDYMHECEEAYLYTHYRQYNESYMANRGFHFYCFNFNDFQLEVTKEIYIFNEDCKRSANVTDLPCVDHADNLTTSYMILFMKETGFTSVKGDPFKYKNNVVNLNFSNKLFNYIIFNLVADVMVQDTGSLFPSVTEYIDFNIVREDHTTIFQKEETKFPTFSIRFKLNDTYHRHYRTYYKLTDFLGSLGGSIYIILLLAGMINTLIKHYIFDLYMLEKYFDEANFLQKHQTEDSTYLSVVQLEDIQQRKPIVIPRETGSRIGLTSYVKATVMNRFNIDNRKHGLLKQNLSTIENYKSLSFIISKLTEIEIIKKFLFNSRQLLCFDFISKSLITGSHSTSNKDSLVNYFTDLLEKHQMSEIDERILRNLEEGIRDEINKRSIDNSIN